MNRFIYGRSYMKSARNTVPGALRMVLRGRLFGASSNSVFIVNACLALVFLFALPVGLIAKANDANGQSLNISIRKSLVRVRVFPVSQNYIYPWVSGPGRPFTAYGVVVPRNRILMRAEDVRKAGLLQVQKYSSYKLTEAQLEYIDMESNLALVRVKDPASFFSDLMPLPSGQDPDTGYRAEAVKIDSMFRVYREEIRITDIKAVADFGFTHLPSLVFRADESFARGGLLVCGSRLCGMISYANSKRVEAVPISVLDTFRKRVLGGSRPFVSAGFYLRDMVDPARRKYFGLSPRQKGALVTRVLPGTSAWGALQKRDILLSIEGIELDNAGFYHTEDGSRRPATMLFVRQGSRLRKPGETIHVTLLRNKRVQRIRVRLRAYTGGAERIPWLLDGRPDWLIRNGVLFLELSLPLLRQVYGASWKSRAIELSNIFNKKQYYERPGSDRVLVLARVFPDAINRGYERIFMQPVASVAGKTPKNLREMARLLDSERNLGKKSVVVKLSGGPRIYLDLLAPALVEQRILQKYRIPQAEYFGDQSSP